MSNTMKKLSKSDLFHAYAYWMMFALAAQNMERMEAPAFAGMMWQVADKLYDDPEEQKALMLRHTQFYNSQPMVGVMINGIALGMEEQRACGENVPDELISSTKTALMGPFAGVGDSLFIGTLIPILLSIGLGLVGEQGSLAGPLFYIIAWQGIMLPFTWLTFRFGYRSGITAIHTLFESGMKDVAVRFANIVGLIIVGCISAQYVSVKIGWAYVSGEMTMSIQSVLDGILPGLLPLLLTLGAWALMEKKHWKMGRVFVLIFAIAMIGRFFGILA